MKCDKWMKKENEEKQTDKMDGKIGIVILKKKHSNII